MVAPPTRTIFDTPLLIDALPAEARERFERIYHITAMTGHVRMPETMHPWATSQFGSLQAIENQPVIKITNRVTLEGTLFNPLRARRPLVRLNEEPLAESIESSRGDHFCHPLDNTAEDIFGRIRGRHCVTASNVAKADAWHGIIIFDDHDPFSISEERVRDYFTVALKWAKAAHNVDRAARYFFLWWNCFWPAGASVIHGHAQMTLTAGMHYPRVEHWRRAALLYRLGHGCNYFEDLTRIHLDLGLGIQAPGCSILASLTPIKERELIVIGEKPDENFLKGVYLALDTLVSRLGTTSFSLAFYWPPIDGVEEDWTGFPAIVRMVDRGDPSVRAADIGSLELYAISTVSSDPFSVCEALQKRCMER